MKIPSSRLLGTLLDHPGLVLIGVLILTAAVGAGVTQSEGASSNAMIESQSSPEQDALETIEATYGTDNTTVAQVVVRSPDENVLGKESLLESLRLQRSFESNETVAKTLDDRGAFGFENVVARMAYAEQNPEETTTSLTIDEQIGALKSSSPAEIDQIVGQLLDGTHTGERDPTAFLPADYEPGTATAHARVTIVTQNASTATAPAQLVMNDFASDQLDDGFVFGSGRIDAANSSAIGDSFIVITPIALLLVVIALAIAYRDVVDVLVSLSGVAVVMVWLAGIRGWFGIGDSSMLIAVPFLLVGLSIDYSLHIIMRYRQASDGGERIPRDTMNRALGSVGAALLVAGFTTAIGFFANYSSSIRSIREFALLSTAGILSLVFVFILFVPALKLLLERGLRRLGRERSTAAVGRTTGPIQSALTGTASLTSRLPVVILLFAVVFAGVGAYSATSIDTSFNQADFLPQDAPEWMDELPAPFAPDEYTIAKEFSYVSDTFTRQDQQAQLLVRGSVTDTETLAAVDRATTAVVDDGDSTIVTGPTAGSIQSPPALIRSVSARNETVATLVAERDTDGDGLPDRDLEPVYDAVMDVAPEEAQTVLYHENGTYESARVLLPVESDEPASAVATDTRAVADDIEADASVSVIATGEPVVTAVVQTALFTTMVEGFAITVGVILLVLAGLAWIRHRRPSLGIIMLVPVVLALAWLLGTMAVLDVPFNSETVVITSLAIGLGVDYSVHLTERFLEERPRHDSTQAWITAGLTGTGGALFGSALTTAAGFGVLALSLSPPLRRFGLVTALSIGFSFVACVTVLPALFAWRTPKDE
ncbi:efflux RND transporter permease subunit [Halocatena halophila]|uniref:efflux RND transporter permease subunit n=1 Tax=Halocatena halophila TaxID=2814576 RepID=UPI002ED2631C